MIVFVLRVVAALLVVVGLFVIAINLHVQNFSEQYIKSKPSEIKFADPEKIPVVLILGASVRSDGSLSSVLEDRVNTALDVYQSGLARKILVSGDNSTAEYNEVIPVRSYLLKRGVPEEDIFVDFAGFDTYDSIFRAGYIFEANNIFIVTQNFHLPRAIYIGRGLGLDVYGITADRRSYLLNNNFRETLAIVKTFLEMQIGSEPKFLGQKIPITGDGRTSLE